MKSPRYLVLYLLLSLLVCIDVVPSRDLNGITTVDVGVILDLATDVGKMSNTCMSMALTDYYATGNHNTKLVLHTRDSRSDIVDAASSAIDLLKNVQVKAILGPQQSSQADFIVDIGNKTHVPVISFTATSPLLSHHETPYFIRLAPNESSQVQAIASIVQAFNWREVVPIYEDTKGGGEIIPYLADALLESGSRIPYKSAISPFATDDQILKELYKLMTMRTRVFVVHVSPSLASRVFLKAKEIGMMRKDYAWIVTDRITNVLSSLDSSVIGSMQGVVGVKSHIPKSKERDNFEKRWREIVDKDNPGMSRTELNAHGFWAYDSLSLLARAVETLNVANYSTFSKPDVHENASDVATIGISELGPKLIDSILNMRFEGLSGNIKLIDGQLELSAFEIVNVIGNDEKVMGFWNPAYGLKKSLDNVEGKNYTVSKDDLEAITWPGESKVVPKGWEMPTSEKKLKVGVPVKRGFKEFVNVKRDSFTNAPIATGFCISVFEEVIRQLPYAVPFEYVPFETFEGSNESAGDYDDLVKMVANQSYDVVVGDVTILTNRFSIADFAMPFTESGVSMVVPIKRNERNNAWVFMKPLTKQLWLTTGAFFMFTGLVVWILEHRVNKEFRGPRRKQVGMIFWFSFSTLVFAHKEKVVSNLSRFVVIVWIFVVLVLTSSYTASLTSMLTIQQLEPSIRDIDDLIKNGENIGYQHGSFIPEMLKDLNITENKHKEFSTLEQYHEALSNGSVGAIMDELPYIRLLLAKHCGKYVLVGPTYKAAGFGFAFPKGSPLVRDVSIAVLNVTQGQTMIDLTELWLGDYTNCATMNSNSLSSDSLTLDSFKGLFFIAAISSTTALFIFAFNFLRENRNILASKETSMAQKLAAIAKAFYEEKHVSSDLSNRDTSSYHGIEMAAMDHEMAPHDTISNHSRSLENGEVFFSPDGSLPVTERSVFLNRNWKSIS